MKLGLPIVLALVVGAVVAHLLLDDHGYVLVRIAGWRVETSVPMLVLGFALVYVLLRVLGALWRTPRRLRAAAQARGARRARARFTNGLIALAEGRWRRAERALAAGARSDGVPLMHYLAAAEAAQRRGDSERRDHWLELARESTPEADTTARLTQAALQLEAGEFDAAATTLDAFGDDAPPRAAILHARLLEATGQWAALAMLLERLQRDAAVDPGELERLATQALTHLYDDERLSEEALVGAWQALPESLRQQPALVAARVRALQALELHTRCDEAVREALDAGIDDDALPLAWGELLTGDDARHLGEIETRLQRRPEDPLLLQAAGRVALRIGDWDRARDHLRHSLDLRPRPDTWQLYARLLEHLGETDAAADAYRTGLALAAGRGPSLPKR